LKKAESTAVLREEKLKELEGLLLHEDGDLMEHSMSVDGSIVSQADLRQMQDTIRKLEEDQ
jgi:succinate dehydrogenase flavin-adding protein (antitoxin of CptAB toxin-antitoxin module)